MPADTTTHKFQAPKGTRDFFPAEMAVRRHIERAWREVSVNHGFDEVEGPTFEHLELYTVKSGPGIVSELFSFRRQGGDDDYALRPEFTPTLARMVASRGTSLPRPIRWFSIPTMFRAERPQRGRLREHVQWNADVLGDETPRAEAEVITAAVTILERLGLTSADVRVKISHRGTVTNLLTSVCGLDPDRLPQALDLLDRRAKIPAEEFDRRAAALGLDADGVGRFDALAGAPVTVGKMLSGADEPLEGTDPDDWEALRALAQALEDHGVAAWCDLDLSIVRGLAYYTGAVFEIHERTGRERALAGGGRYDNLVEMFGGPATAAVGIAMGDVVLGLVLEERGLLESDKLLPRPDVFVICAGDGDAEGALRSLVRRLRRKGFHVRHSYRTTRNVGKLMGEAAKAGSRRAIILGSELAEGLVTLKDLDDNTQQQVPLSEIEARLGRGGSR